MQTYVDTYFHIKIKILSNYGKQWALLGLSVSYDSAASFKAKSIKNAVLLTHEQHYYSSDNS